MCHHEWWNFDEKWCTSYQCACTETCADRDRDLCAHHASCIMPWMISSGYLTPLGYESTAHHVLSIPELLQTIFSFGLQASNVSNALICWNWHESEARPSMLTHNAFATSTVLLQVLQLPHSLHFSSMYSIFKQSYSILQSNIVTMWTRCLERVLRVYQGVFTNMPLQPCMQRLPKPRQQRPHWRLHLPEFHC